MLEKEIIFTSPVAGLIEEPKPALQFIPEEYKKLRKWWKNSKVLYAFFRFFNDGIYFNYSRRNRDCFKKN